MTASFLLFRPLLPNCLPVISSHILHFNATTHTRSFICTWLAIMANLNFYHVYKQTIRASSSQRKSRDRPHPLPVTVSLSVIQFHYSTTFAYRFHMRQYSPHSTSNANTIHFEYFLGNARATEKEIALETERASERLLKLCGKTMKMLTCLPFRPFSSCLLHFWRALKYAAPKFNKTKQKSTFDITYLQI